MRCHVRTSPLFFAEHRTQRRVPKPERQKPVRIRVMLAANSKGTTTPTTPATNSCTVSGRMRDLKAAQKSDPGDF